MRLVENYNNDLLDDKSGKVLIKRWESDTFEEWVELLRNSGVTRIKAYGESEEYSVEDFIANERFFAETEKSSL